MTILYLATLTLALILLLCTILWALKAPPMPKDRKKGKVWITRYVPSKELTEEIEHEL